MTGLHCYLDRWHCQSKTHALFHSPIHCRKSPELCTLMDCQNHSLKLNSVGLTRPGNGPSPRRSPIQKINASCAFRRSEACLTDLREGHMGHHGKIMIE